MGRCFLFTVAFLVAQAFCQGDENITESLGHWDNDFDKPLNFQCPGAEYAVTGIKSYHSNHHEDRRFEISCTKIIRTCHKKSCYWSNYVNSYDALVHFACRSNYYVNGMSSVHNNHYEDRIWRFRCCAITGVSMTDCTLTGWTNSWDHCQNYHVPTGHVIKGMVSIHDNHREDRLYEYMICTVGKKQSAEKPQGLLEFMGIETQEDQ